MIAALVALSLYCGAKFAMEGVSESLACDTTLIHYDPLSQAAADFRACSQWLMSLVDSIAVSPGSVA